MEALIFIPDISGYTKFITTTEIKHSKHILSELIEIIINGNQIGMQVSEIEGDAVLFYRSGNAPTLKELINQVKKMFIDFHTHLKIIQRDNVCQCGACRTAIHLTLKFIAHFGYLQETTIKNFTKIMGSDVILAHRLLKNSLSLKEYLLITDNYFKVQSLKENDYENWITFTDHTEKIENFPDLEIKYVPLTILRNRIPEPVKEILKEIDATKENSSIFVKVPIHLVHELLTDHQAKLEYVPGLKEIKADAPINRINSSHTCVFDNFEVDFNTRSNNLKGKEIVYIEEAAASIGVNFITKYRLREKNSGTEELINRIPKLFSKNKTSLWNRLTKNLKTYIVLAKIKFNDRRNSKIFKTYCEKVANERGIMFTRNI